MNVTFSRCCSRNCLPWCEQTASCPAAALAVTVYLWMYLQVMAQIYRLDETTSQLVLTKDLLLNSGEMPRWVPVPRWPGGDSAGCAPLRWVGMIFVRW